MNISTPLLYTYRKGRRGGGNKSLSLLVVGRGFCIFFNSEETGQFPTSMSAHLVITHHTPSDPPMAFLFLFFWRHLTFFFDSFVVFLIPNVVRRWMISSPPTLSQTDGNIKILESCGTTTITRLEAPPTQSVKSRTFRKGGVLRIHRVDGRENE